MSEERKIKILCVEDEQEIRENIAEILRDEGFEVFEAVNGKHGFEVFSECESDLIISDIMMPQVNGYELLQMIRESKTVRNNEVPFIFLTALGQREDIVKGVNLSANDYLVKPIDFDLMIAKIREKANNAIRVKKTHNKNIDNIKNQVANILPAEFFLYLDIISQTSALLKEEPYGHFPHRRYIEDLEKIYANAMKIRVAIANNLDSSVIDHKLNATEEVFLMTDFLKEFIGNLSDKFKNYIHLEESFEADSLPRVKIDSVILLDALRKIFSGLIKALPEGRIRVVLMLDHFDRMAVVFYLQSEKQINLTEILDLSQIGKILDKQNCQFEVTEGRDNGSVLIIPSHRLIK